MEVRRDGGRVKEREGEREQEGGRERGIERRWEVFHYAQMCYVVHVWLSIVEITTKWHFSLFLG